MSRVMCRSSVHDALRKIRERLACDAGVSLIEILVAAALLSVVSIGVMSALDVSARVSGDQKSKAVAGNIAEGELERLRGLAIEDLNAVNASGTSTRVVGGVTYTITPKADWVADQKGTSLACAVTGGNTYMKLQAKVSWGAAGKNVTLDTVVAPGSRSVTRTYGALALRFLNSADNAPIAGVAVSLASTTGQTPPPARSTDANGCVIWDSVLAGTWTMTASKSGWIAADASTTLVRELNVIGADAVYNEYQLFEGATISGSFYSTAAGVNYGSAPEAYVVSGGGQTWKFTVAVGQQSFTTPYLRRDVGSYKIYAGPCTEAEMATTIPATYAATANAGATGVPVRLPSWDILTRSNGADTSMPVRVDACGSKMYWRQTRSNTPRKGKLDDPGWPYNPTAIFTCIDTVVPLFFVPTTVRKSQNVTFNTDIATASATFTQTSTLFSSNWTTAHC